jgi:hypothetical protein
MVYARSIMNTLINGGYLLENDKKKVKYCHNMKFDVIEYLGKFDGVMVLISLNYNDVL